MRSTKVTSSASTTITCPTCGSEKMKFDERRRDEDLITCGECGTEMGTFGELRSAMKKTALEAARKAFKGIGKRR